MLLLLQACLGLDVQGTEGRLVFANSCLPSFLPDLRITGLRVGEASLDLSFTNHGEDVGINVLRRQGQVAVVTVK